MLGSEKDSDLPPSYDSAARQTLSASSHGVTVTIPTPPSGAFRPGEIVTGSLGIPEGVLGSMEGGLKVRLEGKSSVEVMGKPRYQKAQLLSASLGNPPVVISGRDEHSFALSTLVVPKPEPSLVSSGSKGQSNGDVQVPLELRLPDTKTCDCVLSERSGDGIMPSLGWRGSVGERNRVKWTVGVEVARKGIMKRDIKLSIEVPVSLPSTPSSKSPLVASGSKALTYKSSDTAPAPELKTTLTIYPAPPASPRRIPFRITLDSPFLPSSSQDPQSSSRAGGPASLDDPFISLGLCKHTWTKGIHTSLGSSEGHDFAGIMVGNLKLDDKRPNSAERGWMELKNGGGKEGWCVEGEFEVGQDEVSAAGCGLRLSWSLQVQIRWKKLDSPLVVSQLIHLPHYSTM